MTEKEINKAILYMNEHLIPAVIRASRGLEDFAREISKPKIVKEMKKAVAQIKT